MTYKAIAVGILLLIVCGSAYYMFNKIETQAEQIGVLTTTLETTTSNLNALEARIVDFMVEADEYNKTTEKSNRELSVRLNKLDTDVQRGKNAIEKKPKLVEKAIQKDYQDFGKRMDCITMGECK